MTEILSFKQALSVLSKSSPYSVATERAQSISTGLDDIKKYLYVETDIEKDFEKELSSLSVGQRKIIFLCGSSGDGKSEILTKYSQKFKSRADFHLDATHSFSPQDTAIQTLDKLFNSFCENDHPLVVGINVGMLGNYAVEGANKYVAESIQAFLNHRPTHEDHVFLDFEQYPKFKLEVEGHTSDFAKSLLQRITAKDNNIIRQFFDKEVKSDTCDKRLCANYELLSIEAVQDVVIDLLFKARLMKDQFLTARALLDFIYHLLAAPKYLFDNLFIPDENELAAKIAEFDPANIRSKLTDEFVLSHSLRLPDESLNEFKKSLRALNITMTTATSPSSYLRLFYLLRKTQFSNNYHVQFASVFNEGLVEKYSSVWHLHQGFDNSSEQKQALRSFYKEVVITAIHKYNNRNATGFNKGEFFISKHNEYYLASLLEIKASISDIKDDIEQSVSHFNAYLKIDSETIRLQINSNLLSLMLRIVEGYRPNKHDKNTVVLLDEVVEKIAEIANSSDKLHIINEKDRFKIVHVDDEFEVSGL